jgi:hypothetical protein
MGDELRNFVSRLLETPPGAPKSVQLVVDTDGDMPAMFEVLLMTMTEILKHWYTPPITISRITPEHLGKLIAYFASFGIQFSFAVDDEPMILHINNREYIQKSRLEDMKFKVAHGGKLYTVGFSYLP